jgi:hypothetical protein
MQISVDWVNNKLKYARLCNVHFNDDDFWADANKPFSRLKSTAIPQFNDTQIVGGWF